MGFFVRHCVLLALLAVLVKDVYSAPAPEEEENIAHGRLARNGEFPFQVALLVNGGGQLFHKCGGAIISESVILTAAHCAEEKLSSYIVRAGVNDKYSAAGQDRSLREIVIHPKYHTSADIGISDIALLKLSEPLKFNDKVKSININSRKLQAGMNCTIIGWGRHEPDSPVSDSMLKTGTVTIQSQKDSRLIELSVRSGDDTICKGDSGGPMVCNGVAAGVNSFIRWNSSKRPTDCPPDLSQAFVSVDHYYGWIKENTH